MRFFTDHCGSCYKYRFIIDSHSGSDEQSGDTWGQEIPEVTGKLGLGGQNETGQSLTETFQETALVIANTLFQQHKR